MCLNLKKFARTCAFLTSLFLPFASQAANLAIQHWQTSTGVPVYFIATQDLPMVDIAVITDAGSVRDGEKWGIANLTSSLLNQGNTSQSAKEIAVAFERLGAMFNADTQQDYSIVSLRALSRADLLDPAVKEFHQVLTTASFPGTSFIEQKKLIARTIESSKEDPDAIATQAFFKALYGQHPYAHRIEGDLHHLQSISRNEVQHFYQQFYSLKHISLALVGSISQQQAQQIAEQITQGLPKGKTGPEIPAVKPNAALKQDIPFPANQNYIRLGGKGITLNDPDYFALMVGNSILGGGMTSRLFKQVRETQGLSYNVASYLIPLAYGGAYMLVLQTRQEKSQLALDLTRKLMAEFINQGPTADELALAKQFYTGNFPLKLSTHQQMLDYLISVEFYHRPLNYLDTYLQKVNALTVEDIRQAFKKHFQLDTMAQINVGPALKRVSKTTNQQVAAQHA